MTDARENRTELKDRNQDDGLVKQFAARGIRATRQRLAIFQSLVETPDHPTAADIHRRLGDDHANISLKTVYTVLETLVEGGLARSVAESNGPQQYENRTDHHYHAKCRECGVLIDVPANADGHIRGRTSLPEGFELEEIRVLLMGLCPDCQT